jgi:hypothetical protein
MALFAGGEQDAAEFEVVGVVADGRDRSLRDEAGPRVYLPLAQSYRAKVVLAVRVAGGATFGAGLGSGASRGTGVGSDLARGAPLVASAIHDAIRTELRALDPSLPRLAFAPLEELIADALVAQRIGAILTTLFGVAGLLLTAVGLYGVLAFTVAQRTREIGVRIALGAERRTVIGEMLRRGGQLATIGAGIGLVAAVALSRTIEALLFGVSAYDPVAYIAVVALLFATALLASWIPARRAARVDPMVALREE